MFAPHGTNLTFLVDNQNQVVHTWTGAANPGNGAYLEPDGTLVRLYQANGGPPIGGKGGGIQRLAFDSSVLWDFQIANASQWAHHDCALLPNGNVLMLVWDRMTAAQAIAQGRNPALLDTTNTNEWLPDAIVEVEQTGSSTGRIVWEWHLMDHIIQDFDNTKPNFGVVANHPELLDINFPATVISDGEWNHSNSLKYDPTTDLVLLSSPYQEEFWLIDHSTTTAEAAGGTGGTFGIGGDFVYRWGNPQSYRAGTPADQKLFFPHGTHVIPQGLRGAGNVLIFNNRAGQPLGQSYSTVVELQLPATFARPAPGSAWGPSGFVWEYKEATPTNLYSSGLSSVERLPNGNTLVVSGRQAWLFELDQNDNRVWEYFPQVFTPPIIFQVSYYERGLWADRESLTASAGGTVQFHLEAGSARTRHSYIMLGSMSGTSPGFNLNGVHVPLNVDGYTLGLLGSLGTGIFTNWVGVLDATGGATASFPLPPLPALAGINMTHSFLTVHPALGTVTYCANAVPLALQ